MSAFLLDAEHIDLIIDATIRMELIPQSNVDDVGQVLLDQNYRSVNHRYTGSNERAPRYRFKPFPFKYSRSDVEYAVRSYRYQSCETPDWEDTAPAALVDAVLIANELAALDDDPEWVCDDSSEAWVG